MNDNFHASLTKELCLICTKEMDGPIIMNQKLTPGEAKRVKEMHGKVIGFAPEHCKECQKDLEKAFLFIAYDEEKSDMEHLPRGFYRTGKIIGVRKTAKLVTEWVPSISENAIKNGFLFVPEHIMRELGLISDNTEFKN